MATKKEAIVLYPTAAIGHLVSMVELGKFILTHQPSLSIHILTTVAPYDAGSTARYISGVSGTVPSITFHSLPAVTLPPSIHSTANHETLTFEVLRLNNPNVHQALLSISKGYTIHALILDFFCSQAISVASQLNIPAYCYFTSGAASFAMFMYLPTIHNTTNKSFKELNTHLNFPGLPPMPSWDIPKPLLDRDDPAYKSFLNCSVLTPKTAGIIINTFEALEPTSLKALSDGSCIPDGTTPPVYCIGPLIAANNQTGGEHECLNWLDSQPSKSVVFLCFGSLGVFSKEQLKQIADGLERSGHRFLWVVRNPPSEESKNLADSSQNDPDLDSLLPEGFLARTKERGFVVKTWAPQVAVLNHEAVGGFVTHCGWNSTLEAVCGGVPMIAWPLYAEQRLNRVVLVEEINIGLWMHESESGLVMANEVEERVRELMESKKGELVRNRVMAVKAEAKAALLEGGSSSFALRKLVQSWKKK
ncbi:hypothetical protein L6164_008406 [Bauhinia variegata]|uniref:Uncharacterized protein n=2 Tax=Bauhinia variegata TaxID=167791 RepID=A0ACB9PFS1_BAUVA|nr:hypothetical protein L6164_008406 [Bauhinia variegata]